MNDTAAIEDVKMMTLLIDGTLAHDLRTLSVPFNAGQLQLPENARKNMELTLT